MGLNVIEITNRMLLKKRKKRVALVLSSGGARGYAHIGAIEELLEQGYEIGSVAGCSMGSLIGGIYAAGKLPEATEYIRGLGARQLFSLLDFSLSLTHVVKGEKVLGAIEEIVPDVNIEDLPIPFAAVATDINNYEEVVLDKGSLYQAIRSSISVPSVFKPVEIANRMLVDGAIVNPLPLSRVHREKGDLLVAVNVSAPNEKEADLLRDRAERLRRSDSSLFHLPPFIEQAATNTSLSILLRCMNMMIARNTELALQLNPPDILVNIPINRLGELDYDKADSIIEFGRAKMHEALMR